MSDLTDRLRGIAASASQGRWWWEKRSGVSTATVWNPGKGRVRSVARMGGKRISAETRREHAQNAEHIATFDPVLVTAMLDVIDLAGCPLDDVRMKRALARLREVAP